MKNLLTLFLIFNFTWLAAQTFPTETIVDNGSVSKRINILILGDGFLASEQAVFADHAQNVQEQLFLESPYLEYADFFNVAIIMVPSPESGTDHPATATDVTEPVFPESMKDTYFDGTFDGWNIHRLSIIEATTKAFSVAATNYPSYDQILMLLNTTEYGGAGGEIATFTINSASAQVGIHEMGHSFANLHDEYWAGDVHAAEGINMTAETDPALVKWKSWLDQDGIGIYQHVGGGTASEWYRPHLNCKMRALNLPFCNVCKEGTLDKIYSLVTPINEFTPSSQQDFSGNALDFSLDLVLPNPNTLKIVWDLNGQVIGNDINAITIDDFPTNESVLTATVTDTTSLSHKTMGYSFSTIWKINNTTVSVLSPNQNLFYKVFPNPASDLLFLEFDGDFPTTTTSIQLLSPSGQIVFSERKHILNKATLQINVQSFPKGNYILKIKRGTVIETIGVQLK